MPVPLLAKTAERQTLDKIRDWHQGIVEALIEQRGSVLHAIRTRFTTVPRFVGMTESEVDVHYDAQRRELDLLTIFNLVASAEASITDDFFRRVGGKRKDPLALAYRAWNKTLSARKQRRPSFDEAGILDALKETHLVDNNIVGQYRECLRARHWVGHGRLWDKPAQLDRFDPDDVYDRANALLKAMPA